MAWPPQMVDDYMWIPATMFPNGFGNFQTQIDGEIVGDPHHRAFFMIFIRTLAFTIGDWFGCQRSAMWNTNNDFDISSEVLKKTKWDFWTDFSTLCEQREILFKRGNHSGKNAVHLILKCTCTHFEKIQSVSFNITINLFKEDSSWKKVSFYRIRNGFDEIFSRASFF